VGDSTRLRAQREDEHGSAWRVRGDNGCLFNARGRQCDRVSPGPLEAKGGLIELIVVCLQSDTAVGLPYAFCKPPHTHHLCTFHYIGTLKINPGGPDVA